MKRFSILASASLILAMTVPAGGIQAENTVKNKLNGVILGGYIGSRIDGCIAKRVKTQNVDELVNVFRRQDEVKELWGSEFWGKWVQGAVASYRYCGDKQLFDIIKASEDKLMSCQMKDGYIGNYDKARQLTGWDVWGRKYTLLGLIKWHWLTGDKRALKAACRLLDYTLTQFGPDKKHVWEAGLYKGMPPMSILEPVVYMYNLTGNKKYLNFAQYIVDDGERGGPQLIKKRDIPVAKRFPIKNTDEWWSKANGQKAYEMMSCYVGILELSKVTPHKEYLDVVENVYRHILNEEINICGSGSAYECWYDGARRQTRPSRHSMETCVTFTWMQLNEKLLEMTDKPLYADQLERTVYNALMGAMKSDNSQIAQYIPLEGYRHEGVNQCNIHINCCNANGPRAFAMIPRISYRITKDGNVQVNLYIPSMADLTVKGQKVKLIQKTDYPLGGSVELTVEPEKATAAFPLQLRIPSWSVKTIVEVNGKEINDISAGTYLTLNRIWQKGDKVNITFDMTARVTEKNNCMALERGPIVLARDTRFGDGFVDESLLYNTAKNGRLTLKSVAAPEDIWMAFEVPALAGTYAENNSEMKPVRFCDFSSAGNTWNQRERYRVWLPKTLNAQKERNF